MGLKVTLVTAMRMPFPIGSFSIPPNDAGTTATNNNNVLMEGSSAPSPLPSSANSVSSPLRGGDTNVKNARDSKTNNEGGTRARTVLPFSMQLMRCVIGGYCPTCKSREDDHDDDQHPVLVDESIEELFWCQSVQNDQEANDDDQTEPPPDPAAAAVAKAPAAAATPAAAAASKALNDIVSPAVYHPMVTIPQAIDRDRHQSSMEIVLAEYRTACEFYKREMNCGVLTTLRFHIPFLRVSPDFVDADMLALAEILIRHATLNGPLSYIRRLDFSKRKLRAYMGFGSHGALTLAKIVQASVNVTELFLERNRIGPYGATAIFLAVANHPNLHTIRMRRCCVLEKGARAFAEYVIGSPSSSRLRNIDLSANYIGYPGCMAIDTAMNLHKKRISIDLEGNLVFQEVMNCITHGMGVLLAFFGSTTLSAAVRDSSTRHVVSCAVYSTSLVVLYTSSTLYHSFFSMRNTKWVFEVLDKCAIYILISGSYTPFLQIVLAHKPIWSVFLLGFLWLLCFLGITVEFALPTWQYKGIFSLAMYLGMGWSAVVCLPEVARVLPSEAMNLMFLGGVSYTAGVPFFVRNNNLDHAIWHLFVLMGSLFHWLGVYLYVAPYNSADSELHMVQNSTDCVAA